MGPLHLRQLLPMALVGPIKFKEALRQHQGIEKRILLSQILSGG